MAAGVSGSRPASPRRSRRRASPLASPSRSRHWKAWKLTTRSRTRPRSPRSPAGTSDSSSYTLSGFDGSSTARRSRTVWPGVIATKVVKYRPAWRRLPPAATLAAFQAMTMPMTAVLPVPVAILVQ